MCESDPTEPLTCTATGWGCEGTLVSRRTRTRAPASLFAHRPSSKEKGGRKRSRRKGSGRGKAEQVRAKGISPSPAPSDLVRRAEAALRSGKPYSNCRSSNCMLRTLRRQLSGRGGGGGGVCACDGKERPRSNVFTGINERGAKRFRGRSKKDAACSSKAAVQPPFRHLLTSLGRFFSSLPPPT